MAPPAAMSSSFSSTDDVRLRWVSSTGSSARSATTSERRRANRCPAGSQATIRSLPRVDDAQPGLVERPADETDVGAAVAQRGVLLPPVEAQQVDLGAGTGGGERAHRVRHVQPGDERHHQPVHTTVGRRARAARRSRRRRTAPRASWCSCSPAGVSVTLRVVRTSSSQPSSRSSARICLLSTGWVM